MTELLLRALDGTNPLGFLAALGALDATARGNRHATLRWTDDIVPQAMLGGVETTDDLLEVLDEDRLSWAKSLVLRYPKTKPLPDAKPAERVLRDWFQSAYATDRAVDADMLCAIVAEGAFDGNAKAKPSHLHFTAGKQQFLEMVRELSSAVTKDMLKEAVDGPWEYKSRLPSLSWDARGERLYAIRATDPADEKRLGVPGADWLAFRGLIFYPVSSVDGSLRTSACNRNWKHSAFRWPLWSVPASRDVVRSLVADRSLVSEHSPNRPRRLQPRDLTARGITRLLESPIRRNDNGGYGSFSGAETLISART